MSMLLRAIAVGLLIALAEVLNGNLRIRYLQRRFGRKLGKQISFLSGVCLFAVLTWIFLPWIDPRSLPQCLAVGFVWTGMLTLLDLYFGRFVFRMSWPKLWADFNPLKCNLLAFGLLGLLFCPALVYLLRN